ncbi:MAG: flagellar biosynthetic protein FliO [Woeseiaceae bacterium]|nr:flagellar biosynthetic protein FliO [Woeseiaceae bacterium]
MTAATVGGSEILSFAASLVVVVATILALGWLYSRSKSFGGAGNDAINVVASRALGSKERLMVVEVAGKQLLVGMTATQLQTLHVFDAPVVAATDVNAVAGFASRLKTALKEMKR